MQNESAKLETTDNELKIEIEIPGDNKYFNKQILYVNNNTKNPDKMENLFLILKTKTKEHIQQIQYLINYLQKILTKIIHLSNQ